MSFMFEVFYKAPPDARREEGLTSLIAQLGGRLSFREEPTGDGPTSVCLTYEFESLSSAEEAANVLRREGEHVEGPGQYAAD